VKKGKKVRGGGVERKSGPQRSRKPSSPSPRPSPPRLGRGRIVSSSVEKLGARDLPRRGARLNSRSGEICGWHYGLRQPVRVCWSEGVITHIEPGHADPSTNIWIAPPLLDLQINGYGGVDFQQDDLSLDDLLSATRQLRAAGCSQFLLTLITDAWPKLTARLSHVRKLRAESPELQAAIRGWHIEGPFLSAEPGFHGAHDPALMLDPTPEDIL